MDKYEMYEKFSKNNLPQMLYDKERDVREYVFYDNYGPVVNSNLYNALEDITWAGFYYPYTCKHLTSKYVDGKDLFEFVVGHSHSHDFDDVVKALYYSPESFSISKEEEEFYSKQELNYLKRVQKYLLFIGVKDVDTVHIPVARYRNKKQEKYRDSCKHSYTNKRIEMVLNGETDYAILKFQDYSRDERIDYKPKEYTALVTNEDGDYKLYVEYTFSEVKKYKELNEKEKNPEFNDEDKVIVLHFKVLEKF